MKIADNLVISIIFSDSRIILRMTYKKCTVVKKTLKSAVMAIKGVPENERRTFKLWEENAGPCVIFEISSRSAISMLYYEIDWLWENLN